MGMVLNFVIATVIIVCIGGGIGFLIWLKTRPKIRTWNAKVWRTGDGKVAPPKNKETGKYIHQLYLKDLRPYTTDIVQRKEVRGTIVYKLVKLKKRVSEIKPEHETFWGGELREVNLLIDGETLTPMTMGYEAKSGAILFRPTPAEDINQVKGEIIERQDELKAEKSTLEAITPWVVAGIVMLGLFAMTYFSAQGWIESSENLAQGNQIYAEKQLEIAKLQQQTVQTLIGQKNDETVGPKDKQEIPAIKE